MSADWTWKFVRWRRADVSWLLLASRRAPLVLGWLKAEVCGGGKILQRGCVFGWHEKQEDYRFFVRERYYGLDDQIKVERSDQEMS